MIAVDTNVLVRLVVRDDEAQAQRAAELFLRGEVYVCKTVLLETEWVLRFSYELDAPAVLRALKGIVGLPGVSIEDAEVVAEALDLLEEEMDFADALHLACSRDADEFATFDARLVKRAKTASPGRVVLVP